MAKKTSKTQQEKREGNKYDKILKENLLENAPVLLRKVVGLKDFRLEPLKQVKLQTTLEKEPDFLRIIYDGRSPNGRILHIEFEGQDEKITDFRKLEYLGILGKIYLMEIDQHLIYYGESSPKNIKGVIKHTHFTYRYPVHNIYSVSFMEFLKSDRPEEVVFAIWANPEGHSSEEIVQMILDKLIELRGDSIAVRKFIRQLVMLSKKRNLQAITYKKAKEMVQYNEYEDDIFYLIGEEKGLEKGLEKGIEKGKMLKDITTIRNMLHKNLEAPFIAEILEVEIRFVQKVKRQLKNEELTVDLLKSGKEIKDAAKELRLLPELVEVIKAEYKL